MFLDGISPAEPSSRRLRRFPQTSIPVGCADDRKHNLRRRLVVPRTARHNLLPWYEGFRSSPNCYFGGGVTSRTIRFPDGSKKTLGIMQPCEAPPSADVVLPDVSTTYGFDRPALA
ncbi:MULTISPECIES: pyrimidine/purine nucleoside phosphorylase [unclassified Thiocapsa]